MVVSELTFPVLAFTPQKDVLAFSTANTLTQAYTGLLKRARWYEGWRIIDADGREAVVTSISQRERTGPLLDKWTLSVGHRVRVELSLEQVSEGVDFAEVKGRLLAEVTGSGTRKTRADYREFVKEVKAAATIRELIVAFAKYDAPSD